MVQGSPEGGSCQIQGQTLLLGAGPVNVTVCVLPSARLFASLVQKVLCCQEKKVLSLLGPGKCFLTSSKETRVSFGGEGNKSCGQGCWAGRKAHLWWLPGKGGS